VSQTLDLAVFFCFFATKRRLLQVLLT